MRDIPINTVMLRLLEQPHLLIAGATGSGKSVLIHNLIYHILIYNHKMILIDPKRVELIDYKKVKNTLTYETEISDILATLARTIATMDKRFKTMQKQGLKKSLEPHIYIIIDEYADLVIQAKKEIEPLITRIAQLGRAANVHLMLATQRPTRDIITGAIKVNLDSRVALRCPSPQDSRNIIDRKGAELLPAYGEAYYLEKGIIYKISIPLPDQEILDNLIRART